MTYEQNELATIQRQQLRITALENQLTTAHTQAVWDGDEIHRLQDRIADLERQLETCGKSHLDKYDQIVRERDEAQAVAREMAEHHIECDDWGCRCIHCGARDYPKGMRHAFVCPVSKVRAWDAPITPPAEDAPGFSAAHNPDV